MLPLPRLRKTGQAEGAWWRGWREREEQGRRHEMKAQGAKAGDGGGVAHILYFFVARVTPKEITASFQYQIVLLYYRCVTAKG